MHEKIVYLNGSFVPESEAKVSVLDMGFHAGDGVYDVTRTFRHKPFKLKEHNDRLFRSLKYTRIDCGMSQEEMEAAALEVIERNKDLLGTGRRLRRVAGHKPGRAFVERTRAPT